MLSINLPIVRPFVFLFCFDFLVRISFGLFLFLLALLHTVTVYYGAKSQRSLWLNDVTQKLLACQILLSAWKTIPTNT